MLLSAMDEIDRVTEENQENLKKASEDQDEAKRQIKKNKEDIEWCNNFKKKLDGILTI